MKTQLLWIVSLFLLPLIVCAEDPAPGLDFTLAQARRRNLEDVEYDLHFTISNVSSEPISATDRVLFSLRNWEHSLVLDFKGSNPEIQSVELDGQPVAFLLKNEHLVLRKEIPPGKHFLNFKYRCVMPSIKRESDYIYTLFVPDRASQAFPSFDQPDLKARFSLSLTIPRDWTAIGNEAIVEREQRSKSLLSTYTFAKTAKISTYLFAFAAGKFKKSLSTADHHLVRIFYRESDGSKVNANLPKIEEILEKSLVGMQEYTKISYPFSKLDIVLIPSFPFGGMEHPGAIFFKEQNLFLDPSASSNSIINRANTIAHEVAHMWFGDLVTMKWFNEVWLKEVMANFLANKITSPLFPEFNSQLKFYLGTQPGAADVDRSRGTHPIEQHLDNIRFAGSLYGSIIYLKAPILINQLENTIGQIPFRDALREYLNKYSFANASWEDLFSLIRAHSKIHLDNWSTHWIEEAGRPEIQIRELPNSIEISQSDSLHKKRDWMQLFKIKTAGDTGSETEDIELHSHKIYLPKPGDSNWNYCLGNSDGIGYGLFFLEKKSQNYLISHITGLADPMERAVAWTSFWDEFYAGGLTRKSMIEMSFRSLQQETNALVLEYVLNRFQMFYWRFLSPSQRLQQAPDWEGALHERLMDKKPNKDLRPIWWQTYLSIVLSEGGLQELREHWKNPLRIPELPLSETDQMNLALNIALRSKDPKERILDEQAKRIKDNDRKLEFAFERQALATVPAEREAFFSSLKISANRRHEPWVIRALTYLGHPLHGDSTYLLQPGLEWLEELQQTGDIFFPLDWIQAILRGKNTVQDATTVQDFLNARPHYPTDLRNKVLQAADMLFRASSRPPDP